MYDASISHNLDLVTRTRSLLSIDQSFLILVCVRIMDLTRLLGRKICRPRIVSYCMVLWLIKETHQVPRARCLSSKARLEDILMLVTILLRDVYSVVQVCLPANGEDEGRFKLDTLGIIISTT